MKQHTWRCGNCGLVVKMDSEERPGECPGCDSRYWLDDTTIPIVEVYCSTCRKLVDERTTTLIDIMENIRGVDLLTFECSECGQQSTSRRYSK